MSNAQTRQGKKFPDHLWPPSPRVAPTHPKSSDVEPEHSNPYVIAFTDVGKGSCPHFEAHHGFSAPAMLGKPALKRAASSDWTLAEKRHRGKECS
jgi:hypothetical protein